jgi:hypothetical protein
MTAGMPGAASEQPPESQPTASQEAMLLIGLDGIPGTAGRKTARTSWQKRRDQHLVDSYQFDGNPA